VRDPRERLRDILDAIGRTDLKQKIAALLESLEGAP